MGPYRVEKWRFQHNLGVVYGNYAYLRKAYYEDLKGAITFNRKANELQETATYYKYIPGPSINLSKYYRQLHELDSLGEYPFALDSALYFANQAKIIADSMDLKATKPEAFEELALVYSKKNDFEMAFENYKNAYRLFEGYSSNTYEDMLSDAEAVYNTAQAELAAEKQRRRGNIILISGSAISLIILVILIAINQKRRKVESAKRINDLINQQEIASLQGVLEGQEKERKRVAIDLHDGLGGMLSMVKLHFSSLEEKIDTSNPVKEKFLSASELLDLAASEVRMISHDLMSGVLAKFGLLPALEDLGAKINETGQIELNLIVDNMNGSLDGEQELQVYRIVQELVGNTLKHAKASEITIQLNENDESVNLMVEDDGLDLILSNFARRQV